MSELISWIIFVALNTICTKFYPSFYGVVMNAASSVCITFLLFLRIFVMLIKKKTISTCTKNFIMSSCYALLITESILGAAFYYLDNVSYKILIQVFAYSLSILMLVFTKIDEYKEHKLYGGTYVFLTTLDIFFICSYLVIDFFISPAAFEANQGKCFAYTTVAFGMIFLNNLLIDYSKNYWLHKKVLLSKLNTKIKLHKEHFLLDKNKSIRNSRTFREIAYTLDYAPIRLIEVGFIIKDVHAIMIANGRTYDEACEFSSKLGASIYAKLMKRKYDYTLYLRPIVKILQTLNKFYGNKRNLDLSI